MDLTASNFRPPCWPADQSCPNPCAEQVRDQITRNHVRLHGPWAGWRLAGRDLVSPEGIRMSPTRLQGLAWRQDSEVRLSNLRKRNAAAKAGHRGMVTVVRMPARDWHAEHFGTVAG